MQKKTLHFGSVIVTRSNPVPHNAVAACAYRCGQNLYDEKLDKVHYYSNRKGIIAAEIMAPDHAPEWMRENNWARFGNEIEKAEDKHNRRTTALLGKDFQVAAPRELTEEQNWQLAKDFARKINDRGLSAAVAYHTKDASDGKDNPHFHFLVPMRDVNENGFGKRYRKFDGNTGGKEHETMKLRQEYYACVNKALADAGVKDIYYDPQKQENLKPKAHMGKDAARMAKRGERTRVGDYNRRVDVENSFDKLFASPSRNGEAAERTPKYHKYWESYEKYRLHHQLNRGSAMATRDATQKSQSNVATPPVNRAEKATEMAREGAILASRQTKSWQDRIKEERAKGKGPEKER